MFNAATRSMVSGARSVDTAISNTTQGFTAFKAAIASLGIAPAVKSVVEASDSFTSLRGRLDAILGSSTAAQAAMDGIAAAATRPGRLPQSLQAPFPA